MNGDADLRTQVATKEIDSQRIECFNVLLEAFRWEVRVAFDDIHNDRTPGDNVAVLRFLVEEDEAADDVGTEAKEQLES